MQQEERVNLPGKTEPSSTDHKQIDLTELPVGDLIIPESGQVQIQQKSKKPRASKSRAKINKAQHKTTNSMVDDKGALNDLSRQHKKPQIKRKAKEKRKLKTFTRRLWGDDEDRAIAKLVKKYGIKKWTLISRKLQEEHQIYGRSGKQCRER